MSAFSLGGIVADVLIAILGFLSSPFGGRDIGHEFMKSAGLRSGPRRRK